MKRVGQGLDAPLATFDILRRTVGVEKGVLFLRDYGTDELRPWASVGYDPTTQNRLRLRRATYDELFGESKTPVVLQGDELEIIRDLFSTREYSALERAACLPLGDGTQNGVVLITDCDFLRAAVEVFRVVLAAIGPDIASLVLSSPTRRALTAAQTTIFGPGDLPSVLREITDHAGMHKLSVLGIKLSPRVLYERIKEHYADLQVHHVEEDFRRLIARMMGTISHVVRIPGGEVVVLMLNEKNLDGELVVRQIEVTAEGLFDGMGEVPHIESEIHDIPPESGAIERFLQGLAV
jgi:hypothetical protein